MRKDLLKRIASAAICFAVMAEPLLVTSCKGGDKEPVKPADYGSYGADVAREIAGSFPKRSAYSDGEAKTGEYIKEKIKELGYEPEVQTFFNEEGGKSANYIVKIAGTGFYCSNGGTYELTHRIAVVGTHYDAALLPEYVTEEPEEQPSDDPEAETTMPKYIFDGISDNASGTACILTALKAMQDYQNMAFDIWFVFFGANTDDCAGARYFCQQLKREEAEVIDVMYDVESLYAGDKVYASSGYNSFLANRRYEMRRKLYQTYDTCFSNTLYTNYGFDLYLNESGIKDDMNDDGYKDIFNEVSKNVSDYKFFDERLIPVVYIESYDFNFNSLDKMKDTKNLSFQDFNGNIRRTPADCTYFLDSVLVEEDYDRNGDGEIDCSGDRLQIRINCIAFIVVEALLKGSDKGMTPADYEAYKTEQTRQTFETTT